jgi:hypothetical protein
MTIFRVLLCALFANYVIAAYAGEPILDSRDKWMYGSCSVIGLTITKSADKFPSEWRQLALSFLMLPVVSNPPIKDDPRFIEGQEWAEKQLLGQAPMPDTPIYLRGINACTNWMESLLKKRESQEPAR